MIKDMMKLISASDPEVGAAVKSEYARQVRNVELIASENFVSPAVMAAMATVLNE